MLAHAGQKHRAPAAKTRDASTFCLPRQRARASRKCSLAPKHTWPLHKKQEATSPRHQKQHMEAALTRSMQGGDALFAGDDPFSPPAPPVAALKAKVASKLHAYAATRPAPGAAPTGCSAKRSGARTSTSSRPRCPARGGASAPRARKPKPSRRRRSRAARSSCAAARRRPAPRAGRSRCRCGGARPPSPCRSGTRPGRSTPWRAATWAGCAASRSTPKTSGSSRARRTAPSRSGTWQSAPPAPRAA